MRGVGCLRAGRCDWHGFNIQLIDSDMPDRLSLLRRSSVIVWIAIFFAALVWSAIYPADRTTWWLEVTPALIGVPVLAWLYPRVRFTPLVYWLILIHAIILMIGGKYTYAEVPFEYWLRD